MPRRSVRANRLVRPSDQVDRGAALAPHRWARYWCANDHLTTVPFAADVELPGEWSCDDCGGLSGLVRGSPPPPVRTRVFPRTPYEFLMMRRTQEEADRLLAEAVSDLRRRRLSQQPSARKDNDS